MAQKAKSFEELEGRNWCTNGYHLYTPFPSVYITDGVKDFIESFGAGWVIDKLISSKDVRDFKYGHFPRIEVEEDEGSHIVDFFCGKVDDMGEEDTSERPFACVEDKLKLLPLGKLYFEIGVADPEGRVLIIALMSEH